MNPMLHLHAASPSPRTTKSPPHPDPPPHNPKPVSTHHQSTKTASRPPLSQHHHHQPHENHQWTTTTTRRSYIGSLTKTNQTPHVPIFSPPHNHHPNNEHHYHLTTTPSPPHNHPKHHTLSHSHDLWTITTVSRDQTSKSQGSETRRPQQSESDEKQFRRRDRTQNEWQIYMNQVAATIWEKPKPSAQQPNQNMTHLETWSSDEPPPQRTGARGDADGCRLTHRRTTTNRRLHLNNNVLDWKERQSDVP